MNDLITIKQLPIIEEKLKQIKEEVSSRTEKALSLVCTEGTLQTVKKERAALNKESKEWEERRREVKTAIMAPYEQFEAVYKDCISDVFKSADSQLKSKIDSIETSLKEKKLADVEAYFAEYMESKNMGLDKFIAYERTNINVTLSASIKSLKEQVKSFIDRVCEDLHLIETQENKEEVLHEYKQTLNVSAAITTVTERHKAINEAKAKEAERQEKEAAEREATAKVDAAMDVPLAPPKEEAGGENLIPVRFTVYVPQSHLKSFKEYMTSYFAKEGYRYE